MAMLHLNGGLILALYPRPELRNRICPVLGGLELCRAGSDDRGAERCTRAAGVGGAIVMPLTLTVLSAAVPVEKEVHEVEPALEEAA
jgi:hypothetical protein